jgi:hypothetical protein
MAGVEGQRIRNTFARRGFSGRTLGAAFDPVPLTYGVLPTTRLIFGVDFAGVSRLPANSMGGDRLKAKIGRRLAHSVWTRGCFGGRGIGKERCRWAVRCLVEVSVAQTDQVSEGQIEGVWSYPGLIQAKAARLFGLIAKRRANALQASR